MSITVGVDVGGTFTDLISVNEASGEIRIAKVPSTPADQSLAIIEGLMALGIRVHEVTTLVHATTVGTNAIIERKGSRCGLVTTRGFRDILELRRRDRPDLYGLRGTAEPLIARDLRLEVSERTYFDGTIGTAVDSSEVRAVARELAAAGVEVLVISFLHSYANPENERKAGAAASTVWPNEKIVLGSDVVSTWGEFERTSTAVAGAYILPAVSRYLSRLSERLRHKGFTKDVLVVQSNGGLMTSELARQRPVHTVHSGPAAGVIAAAWIARLSGFEDVISLDMGGTSCDIALIRDGVPSVSDQTELEFGIPVCIPSIDLNTIGAGGGSIASLDRGGILQVGPESAGSLPGPASYSRGGTRPTVTDANLVVGWLDPESPLGTSADVRLDLDRARAAIKTEIADPLGLTVEAAAEAIIKVVNARMVERLRLVSVQRGHDPREFALVAFGGAGPLHASSLCLEVGFSRAIIPRFPGVTSATGCVVTDVKHTFERVINKRVQDVAEDSVRAVLEQQAADGHALLQSEGLPIVGEVVLHEADVAYEGQTHSVRVRLSAPAVTRVELASSFAIEYEQKFGAALEGRNIRLESLRTTVTGVRSALSVQRGQGNEASADLETARLGLRKVYVDNAWRDCPVYSRTNLPVGQRIAGPAVIVQSDSTVAIGMTIEVYADEFGNLILEPSAAPRSGETNRGGESSRVAPGVH